MYNGSVRNLLKENFSIYRFCTVPTFFRHCFKVGAANGTELKNLLQAGEQVLLQATRKGAGVANGGSQCSEAAGIEHGLDDGLRSTLGQVGQRPERLLPDSLARFNHCLQRGVEQFRTYNRLNKNGDGVGKESRGGGGGGETHRGTKLEMGVQNKDRNKTT